MDSSVAPPGFPLNNDMIGQWVIGMNATSQETTVTIEALRDMLISDVLERWPAAAAVFHDHGMACVGCAVAPFYTINDAALVYGLDPEALAEQFMRMIQTAGAG
ncbi:MAG: DUF1858 domain-containing protein [Anaerolineae bacterium]|nr:DUF1858 domain-containing protein [Anaerolineae bacterium]